MNENDGSGFLPHECVFRKLASERLERVTELAGDLAVARKEHSLCDHDTLRLETECVRLTAERDAAQAAANKLIAELVTVRAENERLKCRRCDEQGREVLALRSDLASERQERIEWQGCAKAMERSFTTAQEAANKLKAELTDWRDINRVWEGEEALVRLKAELAEAQNGYNDHVTLSRRLTAELTTAREDTRRAERDWTKALAERDEARAQRDTAVNDTVTDRVEIARLRQELTLAKALGDGFSSALFGVEAELATARAALSTLEQAAWEAVWSWHGFRLYGLEIDKWGNMTALERALNEVSK